MEINNELDPDCKKIMREKLFPLIKISAYTAKILPIHCKQMQEVVDTTEQFILTMANSFNEIIDKLYDEKLNLKDSEELKDIHNKIDDILFSLQFQDSSRQVVEHIQNDLNMITKEFLEVNSDIKNHLGITSDIDTSDLDCYSSYTMKKERDNYKGEKSDQDDHEDITFLD